MTDETESFWPTKESALAELRDRELQARIRAHYKHNDGAADASERYSKAKEIAAEQDKTRSWGRRRA